MSVQTSQEVQTNLSACDFLVPSSPLRPDESARLQRLCDLQALGLESCKLLDDITAVLGWIMEVPIVLVSLVTAKKLCFQSRYGLQPRQAPREESSLCAWCISPREPSVLVVEDARVDQRVMKSGIVQGPPYVRFYAGCPLQSSDGFPLGTLCLIDQRPRQISAAVSQLLVNFAEIVTRNIERFDMEDYQLPSVELKRLQEESPPPHLEGFQSGALRKEQVHRSLGDAHLLVMVSQETTRWPILYADSRWHKLTNISVRPPSRDHPESKEERLHFWDVASYLDPCGLDARRGAAPRPDDVHAQLIGAGATFGLSVVLGAVGERGPVEAMCRCVPADMPLDANAAAINTRAAELCSGHGREVFHIDAEYRLYFFVVHPVEAKASAQARRALEALGQPPPPGLLIRDLELKQLIGSGSFGRVYLGTWIGAQVAIKVLRRKLKQTHAQAGAPSTSAFEAALSATLSHPNLVQTYEFTTQQVETCDQKVIQSLVSKGCQLPKSLVVHEMLIVQEWCDRGSLTPFIQEKWPLGPAGGGPEEVLEIATDMARALVYMHDRSIMHGDLSSNNVLLKSQQTRQRGYIAKICDFGLARSIDAEAGARTDSLGSVQYMPPELLAVGMGPPELTCKVDVYSMGVIVWQLCSGRPPYENLTPPQVVMRVIGGAQLKVDPESVPPDLVTLTEQCMHRSLETRLDARGALEVLKRSTTPSPGSG